MDCHLLLEHGVGRDLLQSDDVRLVGHDVHRIRDFGDFLQ